MIDHIQLVLFVGFLQQVTVHKGLARARFDLDLIAFLPLHCSFSDEDLGTDILEVTIKLLALIEVSRSLVIARIICKEVSVNAEILFWRILN